MQTNDAPYLSHLIRMKYWEIFRYAEVGNYAIRQ